MVRPDSTRAFFALAGKHLRYELLDLKQHYRAASAMHPTDGVAGRCGPPAHQAVDPAPRPDELDEWCAFQRQIETLPEQERAVVDLREAGTTEAGATHDAILLVSSHDGPVRGAAGDDSAGPGASQEGRDDQAPVAALSARRGCN
jgi:hypothetical protein